jgi:uncharacterized protein (TIGR02996 family)
MNSEADFRTAIRNSPDDQLLLSAFADWLEENGDERAPWVRDWRLRSWMGPDWQNPIPKLVEALKACSKRVEVRRCFAALGEAGVKPLLDCLDSSDSVLRQDALQCLAKIGKKATSAMPKLFELLKDPDAQIRDRAAKILRSIRPKSVDNPEQIETLKEALNDADYGVRTSAAEVLGSLGSKRDILEELSAELSSDSVEARITAVASLGKLKIKAILEPLCRALKDRKQEVRIEAARQLRQVVDFNSTEAVEPLRMALKEKNTELRSFVLGALCQIGLRAVAAIPDLAAMLETQEKDLSQVVETIAKIGSQHSETPAILVKTLQHPEEKVAIAALYALRSFEGIAVSAIPAMLAVHRKTTGWWFQMTTLALGRLQRPTPELFAYLREIIPQPTDDPEEYDFEAYDRVGGICDALACYKEQSLEFLPLLLQWEETNPEAVCRALVAMGEPGILVVWRLLRDSLPRTTFHYNRLRSLQKLESAGQCIVPAVLERCEQNSQWAVSLVDILDGVGVKNLDAQTVVPVLLKLTTAQHVPNSIYALLGKFGSAVVPHLPELSKQIVGKQELNEGILELIAELGKESDDAVKILASLVEQFNQERLQESDTNTAKWNLLRVLKVLRMLWEKGEPALAQVLPLLTDRDLLVRHHAASVISMIADERCLPALRKTIYDENEDIRRFTVLALGKIGAPAAVAYRELLDALIDIEKSVRRVAADTLGVIGVANEAVFTALTKATTDPDKQTQANAKTALKRLSKPKRKK